jgi:hypothetical protein
MEEQMAREYKEENGRKENEGKMQKKKKKGDG